MSPEDEAGRGAHSAVSLYGALTLQFLCQPLRIPALVLPAHGVHAAVSIVCVLLCLPPLCVLPVSSSLPRVACSVSIPKVRDDSEGGVIHQPLAPLPSLPLGFHVLSFLPWYVDFIKFSSGWVIEKTGGGSGESSLLSCFHLSPSSFMPARGHGCGGPSPRPSQGTGIGDGSAIASGGQSGRADKKSLNLPKIAFSVTVKDCQGAAGMYTM